MPYSKVSSLSPGRIALGYGVAAILWIAFSDAVVTHFKLDPAVMTIKGAVFVFVTASLLYFTIRRLVQTVQLASQERDETAKLYRTVVKASNEGICLLDQSGRISFLNGRLAAMLGRPEEELQGKRLQDFIEEPHVLAQQGAQQPELHECRLRTGSDRKPWVLISRHPVLNDAGEGVQVVGTVIDITERKWAEQEVRNTAAQWQATFDAVPDVVLLLDKDGRILRANHAAAEFLGLPCDTIVGGHCYGLIHGTSTPPAECPLAKMRQSRRHEEAEVLAREGGPWLSVSADPVFDPSGELTHVVHVTRDITERKRAGDTLRQSEAYLAEAQRLSHTGSWAFDVAGDKYVYVSEECLRIFELDAQEDSWTRGEVSRLIHPEDRPRVNEAFEKSIRERVDTSSEFRITLPSGTLKHVHAIRHPALNDAGEVVKLVGTVIDITERKRAEEELRRSEMYLSETQKLAHTGTWVWDPIRRKFLYASDEMLRLYGFDPHEGIPTPDRVLERIHPDDRDKIIHTRTGSADVEFDYKYVLPDGTLRHFHCIAHPVVGPSGEAHEVLGIAIDITDRKRAEEERHQSAERFRAIADYTYDWESWIGVDGKLLWVNPAVERITGYTIDECMAMPGFPVPIVAEADRETVARQMRAAVQGSSKNDFEFRVRHKHGRLAWVAASWQPIYDSRGARLGHRSSIRDIAERKQAEDAVQRSQAYLAEAERLSHAGSWALDVASGKYLYASEEFFRIFGLDAQEGLPSREDFSRLIHPEDWDRANGSFEQQLREKVDITIEYRIVLPDGTVRHLYVIRHPILNEAGDVVQLVGTVMDITDRKRAEDALRESETRFRTFVDHAADAFFMLDCEQGIIIDVNRCACESLGYTRQELVGMTAMAFHLDADRAQMESVAERAAAGETVVDTHRHRRKDGSVFPVEVHSSLVSYGGRRFLLKVARDISERGRAEEQRERLRQLEADLAHINRVSLLGELTASIAHEVNQPLVGVVSNAGASLRWLAGDPPNLDRAREAILRIGRDGKRAGEIIARIRAMTKKAATPNEKLALNDTIQDVLALVRDEATRHRVILRPQFADDLAPVAGDRVQVQQVVLNLVMNGIEAMGSVDGRARDLVITTRNLAPDQVQVTVEDSGTGLDPNTIDKIFDPFYTTKPGGMGMGLSISRSIIEAHGGRLWATAKDGPGTTFHFTLPTYHEDKSHA